MQAVTNLFARFPHLMLFLAISILLVIGGLGE